MSAQQSPIQADQVRIVGQGLTGSLLALSLHQRGIPFVVQDVPLSGASTEVAPGIVNPLAGRKFHPPDNIHDLLAEVHASLAVAESVLQESIWHACPILRIFADPSQIDRFEKAISDGNSRPFVEERHPENSIAGIHDVFGSFTTSGGGWANLPLLKSATRDWLKKSGRLLEEAWTADHQNAGEWVCFCEGWRVSNNPSWEFIPHNPAKGEMLIVAFEEPLPNHRIYNQSCWIQPFKEDLWRVGATYSWSAFNSETSSEATSDLRDKLKQLTPVPFKVIDQVAGVRPIVEDYKPVLGKHPIEKNWFILNAMGSKGVLQAPFAVKAFTRMLLEGASVPASWNVDRFL